MHTAENILGFSNPWYEPAIASAELVTLENDRVIRHAAAPYFIGTKLAAFEGRGNKDFIRSHDLEDIIAVLNGRPELVDEISASEDALRKYISEHFQAFLENSTFRDTLPGLIIEGSARATIVHERMEAIANYTP